MVSLHIPPPSPGEVARKFLERFAKEYKCKVELRVDMRSGSYFVITLDGKEPRNG